MVLTIRMLLKIFVEGYQYCMKAIENKDMGYVFKTHFISASYYPAKFYLRKSCDLSERFHIYFKLSIDSMHKLECPIQDILQNPKLHLTPSSPCSQLGPKKTSFFQWGQWAKQGLGFTIPLPCCPDLPAVGTEYDLESMERDYETGISPCWIGTVMMASCVPGIC